jgi:hypothetical protein
MATSAFGRSEALHIGTSTFVCRRLALRRAVLISYLSQSWVAPSPPLLSGSGAKRATY